MAPDAPTEAETQPVEEEERPILSPTPSTSQRRPPTPQYVLCKSEMTRSSIWYMFFFQKSSTFKEETVLRC